MNRKIRGWLYVMVPVITWGMSFVSTEFLLDTMRPMTIAAIRFTIGFLFLFLFLKSTGRIQPMQKGDRKYYLLSGAIGIAAYFYFENTGILYISATPSTLIIATLPVFTLLAEMLIDHRKPLIQDIFAVLLSVVGVVFTMRASYGQLSTRHSTIGYLMMFGAVISWVVYSVASKKILNKYSYANFIFYQFMYSLPFLYAVVPFERMDWSQVGTIHVIHIVLLSLFATLLGFYCYAKAMDDLGVTEASLFINFLPIVTIVFGHYYLHHVIYKEQIIGTILIIVAACIAVVSPTAAPEKIGDDMPPKID